MNNPIPSRLGKSVVLLAAGFALAASVSAAPLLEETFPAGERTTQDLPQTSAWYSSLTSSRVDYSAGSLGLNVGTGFLIAYFTDGSSPVSLSVGESLTVEFTFQVTGVTNESGGLRLGLFNSGESRATADGGGDSQWIFYNYTGYNAQINPAATTSSPLNLRQRLAGVSNALIQSNTAYTSALGYGGAKGNTLADNTTYTALFTLTRSAEAEMTIALSITGTGISNLQMTRTDTSDIDTIFDTFVISTQNRAVISFTLNEVTVTYNQVPEAGTTGLLMGVGAASLLMLILRRRRTAPAALRTLLWSALFFAGGATVFASWQSELVTISPDGTLIYKSDEEGNRIPDFSHAGYRGGGVPLPEAPIMKTLEPAEGDNTALIQQALDEVGAMPLDPSTGLRGALMLEPGVYEVSDTLYIRNSGVVLLGYGQGDDPVADTILRRTGTERGPVILAGASGQAKRFATGVPGTRTAIVTPRVTVGSDSFEVADASGFSVGDTIIVEHPATLAWFAAIDGGGTGSDPSWDKSTEDFAIRYLRRITAIDGNVVTIDAPVFNHLDRSLSESSIYRYDTRSMLTEIGVADLRIDIVTEGPDSQNHAWDGVVFRRAMDCWVRDVTVLHFVYSGVKFMEEFARGTAYNCQALEPHGGTGGARRYNFIAHRGSQLVLFEKCHTSYARHAFVSNGGTADSGIVFLNCSNDHSYLPSEGHQHWAQGLLYDGLTTTNPDERTLQSGILGLYCRGSWGKGHGWGAVNSVAWRCDAAGSRIIIQKPPTAQNYAIGCFGKMDGKNFFDQPLGYIEGTDQEGLEPRSLYQAQLAQRLKEVNANKD